MRSIARKRPGDAPGYSIGRDNFEFLMRERLGFDWTLPEALANGERLVDQMRYRLEREAARHGAKMPKSILEEAAAQWTPRRPLLEEYKRHDLRDQRQAGRARTLQRSHAAKRSKCCPPALSETPFSNCGLQRRRRFPKSRRASSGLTISAWTWRIRKRSSPKFASISGWS